MCSPSRRTSGHCAFASNHARASTMDTPNLFSALPVEILAWVMASTSGLIRTDATAVTPRAAAMRWIASSSARDSMLKRPMPTSSASAISASDLPTQRALQFATGHDVSARAFLGQQAQYRAVAVGLDRVADAGVQPGQRLAQRAHTLADGRRGIDIQRGAFAGRQRGEISLPERLRQTAVVISCESLIQGIAPKKRWRPPCKGRQRRNSVPQIHHGAPRPGQKFQFTTSCA